MATSERFWNKVECEPNSGCWIWIGSLSKGYGEIRQGKGKTRKAHRWAYETYRGPIGKNLQPDHLCKITQCVNPWHLQLVSARENAFRSNSIPAKNSRKTHCKRGHPLSGSNLYLWKGCRSCKECQRHRDKQHKNLVRSRKQSNIIAAYLDASRGETAEKDS